VEKEKERAKRRENTQTIHNKIKELKSLIEEIKSGSGPIEDKNTISRVNDILAKQRKIEGYSVINFKKRSTILWVLNESLVKWEKQTLFVTEEHINITKELCKILRIPIYQARGEGETICACLCLGKKVDAVYTQDTDVLAYGCPVQLYDFDVKKETLKMVYLEDVLNGIEFTFEQFQDFCIMLSCDYNDRVKGVGPETSYKLLEECISIEGIEESAFSNKSLKNSAKKVQTEGDVLNYERCRELFKYRRVPAVKWRPVAEIDIEKMNNFLKTHSAYSSYKMSAEKLLDVWQPTKIRFE
jgi:5'-3' exonuclease